MTAPTGGRHRQPISPTPARPTPRTRTLTVVLALLCLPAAAALIVFLVRTPKNAHVVTLEGPTAQAAVIAAKHDVSQILSYDYRTVAANIATAKSETTGVFAQQYASTASALLSQAKGEKAIVSATVGATGVVSASKTDVVVLLFVDQASVREPKGQKSPTTRIDQDRVQVTMTLVGGKWLVSQLQSL